MDYISRDAARYGIFIASDVDRVKKYAYFDGKMHGIGSKARRTVKNRVESYLFMYTDVYNRKACPLWKGVIRRGVYDAIRHGSISRMGSGR